jgi:hypothetical protein
VLLALWGLCLAIGALGGLLAYGASSARVAWPYQIVPRCCWSHAPRRRMLEAGAAQD